MKVKIDLDHCFKSGQCYYNHPKLVEEDVSVNYPRVLSETVPPELEEEARAMAAGCPSNAISIEE